jgi:hypothetical protein
MLSPFCTANVWLPRYVPSLITSLHQNDMEDISNIKPDSAKLPALGKACIVDTPLVVNTRRDKAVYNGHGEGDTR